MTQVACKQCGQEFDNSPIAAWGKIITPVRCKECRLRNSLTYKNTSPASQSPHPADHAPELNPGGYCNKCSWGRDFS